MPRDKNLLPRHIKGGVDMIKEGRIPRSVDMGRLSQLGLRAGTLGLLEADEKRTVTRPRYVENNVGVGNAEARLSSAGVGGG